MLAPFTPFTIRPPIFLPVHPYNPTRPYLFLPDQMMGGRVST